MVGEGHFLEVTLSWKNAERECARYSSSQGEEYTRLREKTAMAKVQRQDRAKCLWGLERRPVWLEHREQE